MEQKVKNAFYTQALARAFKEIRANKSRNEFAAALETTPETLRDIENLNIDEQALVMYKMWGYCRQNSHDEFFEIADSNLLPF